MKTRDTLKATRGTMEVCAKCETFEVFFFFITKKDRKSCLLLEGPPKWLACRVESFQGFFTYYFLLQNSFTG